MIAPRPTKNISFSSLRGLKRCTNVIQRPRILFFQRVVPPEHSAAGALVFDLAALLAAEGFETWLLGTRTSRDIPARETCDGVEIVRMRAPAFRKASVVSRAAALPGTWLALLRGALACPRPDVLVTLSDPPLAVCAGALLARLRGSAHVHWCQDLYPGVAAAAGLMRSDSLIFRILEQASRKALRSCTCVVAVGRCMRERLSAAGVNNCVLVTNWSRLPVGAVAPVKTGSPFTVLYSGNLGRAHDFEGMRMAAEILAEQKFPARIVVRGDGPSRANVHVNLLPPVPWNELPAALAAADAHLITMRREFSGLVVPSKLYDAAASGRPILFAGPRECECARAIGEAGMGLIVPDRDGPALAAAIGRLSGDPGLCRRMGEAALKFSAANRRAPAGAAFSRILRKALRPSPALE